jgi:hypothetical protein
VRAFWEAWTKGAYETALSSCSHNLDNELTWEDAAFGRPWVGADNVARQWRLQQQQRQRQQHQRQGTPDMAPSSSIQALVANPRKVAIRFQEQTFDNNNNNNNQRGIAIFDLVVASDDASASSNSPTIANVYIVRESNHKAGAASLRTLRLATQVMEATGFNPAAGQSLSSAAAAASASSITAVKNSDPSTQSRSPLSSSSLSLSPLQYFDAWNRRDLEAAVQVFTDDVTYDDTAFPTPFRGKETLLAHLQLCADSFPTSFCFAVDDYIDPLSTEGLVCVQWHVENNGVTLPYTRGASFYTLNPQGLIKDGIDFVEPAGPLKPGPWDFWTTAVSTLLHGEPVRWIPLLSWVAYMGVVFLSDGILPGANALALEQRTWEEVRDLSLNFFLVAPLLGLPFSPVVHPVLEGVFNGLLAWAALFAGFLTDDRRHKPNIFPMLPAVIGSEFHQPPQASHTPTSSSPSTQCNS